MEGGRQQGYRERLVATRPVAALARAAVLKPAGHGRGGSGAPPSARRGITGYTPVLGGGDLGPRSATAATPTTATGARAGGKVLLMLQRPGHSSLDLHASL